MKKIMTMVYLLMCATGGAIPPHFTDYSGGWGESNDVRDLLLAFDERDTASGYGAAALTPTNAASAWRDFWPQHLDSTIMALIPRFRAVTNLTTGFYDNLARTSSVPSWDTTNLAAYLNANFVNADGTVGVGIVVPAATGTWYLTQTWETNVTYTLGTLTYTITNTTSTNGTNFHNCAWVFQDGDRIVPRPTVASGLDWPQDWWDSSGLSGWWYYVPLGRHYGLIFDYTDTTGMNNDFRVTALRGTNLASGLSVVATGLTNFLNDGSSYLNIITNTVDVSGLASGETEVAASRVYDIITMSITNTATTTNLDHVGDSIALTLFVPNRLYQNPLPTMDGGPEPSFQARNPWHERLALNERWAIAECLRVTQATTANWITNGANNQRSGSTNANYWDTLPGGDATSGTEAEFNRDLEQANDGPAAQSQGQSHTVAPYYSGSCTRRFAYLQAVHVTNYPVRLEHFVSADAYGTFDDNGDTYITTNLWRLFSTVANGVGSNAVSAVIGDTGLALPTWVSNPGGTNYPPTNNATLQRGYTAQKFVLQYWDFPHGTNGL